MRYLLLTFIGIFGLILTGCIDDDFSTSPSDLLTFSTDTVTFDTVFTDLGTPTARLKVYNRAKKSVNISQIRFKRQDTEFSVNVDGVSGNDFHNVEIRGGDSIYIFIECLIKPNSSNEPYLVEDKLQFVTNGVSQDVQVEAYGQNVTRLHGVTFDSDTRLTSELPYVVFDSLVVAKDAKLSIEPGAKLLFHDKAAMKIYGQLEAKGSTGKMIQMRGDRLDNVIPDVGYDIMAGQWAGLTFDAGSFDNVMEFVDMRSTAYGIRIDSCGASDRNKLRIVNSWLHNSQSNVLQSKYANIEAYGTCFSESAGAVLELTGGKHKFVQCTIANNYLFSVISDALLSLFHCKSDEGLTDIHPLMSADFENCIVYGLAADLNIGDLAGTNVYMRSVLFKSAGSNDEHFIGCIWDKDPLFYTVREDYIFNYRLKNESPAIASGNREYITEFCAYDMFGLNRLGGNNPDIGAFVFVAAPEEPDKQKK